MDDRFGMSLVSDRLWLGSVAEVMNFSILGSLGITHIVNATVDEPNFFEDAFIYHRIPLYDKPNERFSPYLDEFIEFINAAHKDAGTVAVHCMEGISRSVTLVLAYRILQERLSLGKAFAEMRLVRPQAEPNPGFLQELRELEKKILGKIVTNERLTPLDYGVLDEGNKVDQLKARIMNYIVMVENYGPEKEVIMEAYEAVLTTAAEVTPDDFQLHITEIIIDVFENFGSLSQRDGHARSKFAVILDELLRMTPAFGKIVKRALAVLPWDEQWKELCLDLPLAKKFLRDLESNMKELDTKKPITKSG